MNKYIVAFTNTNKKTNKTYTTYLQSFLTVPMFGSSPVMTHNKVEAKIYTIMQDASEAARSLGINGRVEDLEIIFHNEEHAIEAAKKMIEIDPLIVIETHGYGFEIVEKDFELNRKYYHNKEGRKMFFTVIAYVHPAGVLKYVNQQDFESAMEFEKALHNGILSKSETDANYVGNYMYMGLNKNNKALFKHRDTREYLLYY